jgi:hypothetical protein
VEFSGPGAPPLRGPPILLGAHRPRGRGFTLEQAASLAVLVDSARTRAGAVGGTLIYSMKWAE